MIRQRPLEEEAQQGESVWLPRAALHSYPLPLSVFVCVGLGGLVRMRVGCDSAVEKLQ